MYGRLLQPRVFFCPNFAQSLLNPNIKGSPMVLQLERGGVSFHLMA
jgi:hypothetical protein